MRDFTESELRQAFAEWLDPSERSSLEELLTVLSVSEDEGDWTDETLILLSLSSLELEKRVAEIVSPRFVGEAGRVHRRAWDERRAELKAEMDRSGSVSPE